jgi:bacillithiol biosynthesis deacetylase BshB1
MKINLLAFAAHPDDVELSCSATLALHKRKGDTIGIVDLTRGELGSRGSVETRKEEAAKAAQILQLDCRENLGFKDGFFQHDETHLMPVIRMIRKYKPDIILANAPSDRHPDHGRAAELVRDACFYSGLIKIETEEEGELQAPWRPGRLFHYIQDRDLEPHFIIDVSETFAIKLESIRAFSSQFFTPGIEGPATYISSPAFLENLESRSRILGKQIGVTHGEGFLLSGQALGLKDLSGIILPEKV